MTPHATLSKSIQPHGPQSRRVRLAIWASSGLITIVAVLLLAMMFRGNADYPAQTDLGIYLRAADAILHGVSPYSDVFNSGFDKYPYPPALADLLAGLESVIGRAALIHVWFLVCLTSLLAAIVIMTRGFGVKPEYHWVALFGAVVLLSQTVRFDLYHGQVNAIDLVCFSGGLALHTRSRDRGAAACFAVMLTLKPFLGIVVVYFLLRRRWVLVRWTLLLSAALFAVSFLPTGPHWLETFEGWRRVSAYYASPPLVTKPDNKALYGLFTRLFTPTPFSLPWWNAPEVVPILTSITVAGAAAAVWFGLAKAVSVFPALAPERPLVVLFECSIVVTVAMACGPLTDGSHMLMILPAAVAAVELGLEQIRTDRRHAGLWLATIIAWAAPMLFVLAPLVVAINGSRVYRPDDAEQIKGLHVLLTGRSGILLLVSSGMSLLALRITRATGNT